MKLIKNSNKIFQVMVNYSSSTETTANLEAEKALLGEIILDASALARINSYNISPEHFYLKAHQIIFAAILDLLSQAKDIDFLAISLYLSDRDLLEEVGGTAKLSSLLNSTFVSVSIERYAQIIVEKYQRRQLIIVSNDIITSATNLVLEIPSIVSDSHQKLLNVVSDTRDSTDVR